MARSGEVRSRKSVTIDLFEEISGLAQLHRSLLESHLPKGLLSIHHTILTQLESRKEGTTPLDLAKALDTPKTSMTHALSVLQKNGLVRLTPNPDDGRSKLVWITDEGRQLINETQHRINEQFKALHQKFPPWRMAEILPHLRDLRKIMNAGKS